MKRSGIQSLGNVLVLVFAFGFVACSKAPTDASISEAIKASYYSDSQLKNDRVDVTVNNGEVTLAGEVSSEAARMQAYKLANETPGVRKVVDLMKVKEFQSGLSAQQAKQTAQEPAPQPTSRPSPQVEKQVAKQPAPSTTTRPARPETSTAAPARPVDTETAQSPAPPAPKKVTIPKGTMIQVQMIDPVDSAKNQVGEKFLASLSAPIRVGDKVIVPEGADVYVRLTEAKTSGKFTGRSELELELDHLEFQGKSYPLESSVYKQVGKSRGKDTATKTAVGAAVGSAVGAIAGGGKGAAIGAGVGAGSGAAMQIVLKGKQVQVPSETKLGFQLERPLEISLPPGQSKRTPSDK